MKIAIPKERRPHERRVAATPDTVKKLLGLGAQVCVEAGAGAGAQIPDQVYAEAGADIAADAASALAEADIVFKVQRPLTAAEGGPAQPRARADGGRLGASALRPSRPPGGGILLERSTHRRSPSIKLRSSCRMFY